MLRVFQKPKSAKGFTLVELVVVVVIIGILAAIAIPMYNSYTTKARVEKTKSQLGVLRNAVEAYRADTGSLPSATSDLTNVSWPTGYTYTPNTTAGTYTIKSPLTAGKYYTIDQAGAITESSS